MIKGWKTWKVLDELERVVGELQVRGLVAQLWYLALCLFVYDVAILEYMEYQTINQFFKLEAYFGHVYEDLVWTCLNIIHDLTFDFRRGVFIIDDVWQLAQTVLGILAKVCWVFGSQLLLRSSSRNNFIYRILTSTSHIECHCDCWPHWCSHSVEVWRLNVLVPHIWGNNLLSWARSWTLVSSTRSWPSLKLFSTTGCPLVRLPLNL